MAWTETDRDNLKAAIATGARRVRYADGRETEFRTLEEMRSSLAMIEAELNPSEVPPGQSVGAYNPNLS